MRNCLFAATFLMFALPAAAQSYGMAQEGTYRLGGTYLWVEASSATSCAMRCENEARCQAWSYADVLGHSPACELKSAPGRLISRPDMVSGLSPRTLREGARRVVPAARPAAASPAPAPAVRRVTRYTPVSRNVKVPELAGKGQNPGQGQPASGTGYYPSRPAGEPTGQASYYPGADRLSNGVGAGEPEIPQARARIVGSGPGSTGSEYYSGSSDRRPAANRPPRTFPND